MPIRYSLIFSSESAPLPWIFRARSAFALALARAASAPASAASWLRSSARTDSSASRTRGCPFETTEPTSTRTSITRRPSISAAMIASCQGFSQPLAGTVSGHRRSTGFATATVSAAASFLLSDHRLCDGNEIRCRDEYKKPGPTKKDVSGLAAPYRAPRICNRRSASQMAARRSERSGCPSRRRSGNRYLPGCG